MLDRYKLRVNQIKRRRKVEMKKLDLKNAQSSKIVDCADFIDIVKELSEFGVGSIKITCPPCYPPCEPCSCDVSEPSENAEVDHDSASGFLSSESSYSSPDLIFFNMDPSSDPFVQVLTKYKDIGDNQLETTNNERESQCDGIKSSNSKPDTTVYRNQIEPRQENLELKSADSSDSLTVDRIQELEKLLAKEREEIDRLYRNFLK